MTRFEPHFPEKERLKGLAGLADAAASLRIRILRHVAEALHLQRKQYMTIMNPSVALSGSSAVRHLRLLGAIGELSSVPEGKRLVEAAKGKVGLSLEAGLGRREGFNLPPRLDEDGRTVLEPGKIAVTVDSTQGMIVGVLAHELQHQRQLDAGLTHPPYDKLVPPQDRIWWKRFIEADAEATAVESAWKLRQAGKPAAWQFMKQSSEDMKNVSGAYERQALQDPAAVADGRAKRAAFDAWFVAVASGQRTTTFYNEDALGNLPPVAYLRDAKEKGTPFGRTTSQELLQIGAISSVNYLALPGGRPLDDPYYRQPDLTPEQARRLAAAAADYNAVRDGTPVSNTNAFNNAARPATPHYDLGAYAPKGAAAAPKPSSPQPGGSPGSAIDLERYSPGRR